LGTILRVWDIIPLDRQTVFKKYWSQTYNRLKGQLPAIVD
jgi:hypothetical protein